MSYPQRSYNPYIDALQLEWSTDQVTWTYGFSAVRQEVSIAEPYYVPFSEDRKFYFRLAISEYAAVCNLTFTEVPTTDNPNILVAYNTNGAYAGVQKGNEKGSVLLFNTGDIIPKLGTFGYHNYLHEINHALGLRHGQEISGGYKGELPADHFSYG